ncbi:MAG TPA: YggT family protein [Stellaceae bacterium]|jgi:YggT family protein
MGGFVVPVIQVVIAILNIYWYLVIIQAVISWLIAFNIINTYSRPVAIALDFLYRITEPVLRPIRQFVPSFGGLDISPVILLLIIWLVEMELEHLAFYLYAY